MAPVSIYRLKVLEAGKSTLMRDEAAVCPVPGTMLEAQYSVGTRDLILTSQNAPYEESLDILLLENAAVIDRLTLSNGGDGGPAIFEGPRIEGENALSFNFWAARSYLTIHDKKTFRGLGLSGPVRWWPQFWGCLIIEEATP